MRLNGRSHEVQAYGAEGMDRPFALIRLVGWGFRSKLKKLGEHSGIISNALYMMIEIKYLHKGSLQSVRFYGHITYF